MSGIEGSGFGSFDKLELSLSPVDKRGKINPSGLSGAYFAPVDYGDPDSPVTPPATLSEKMKLVELSDAYFSPVDSDELVGSAATSTSSSLPKDPITPQPPDRSGKLHL